VPHARATFTNDSITLTGKPFFTVFLDLSINNFDGPIPDEIGALEKLGKRYCAMLFCLAPRQCVYVNQFVLTNAILLEEILNLAQNNFTGPVPESIGQLGNLTLLDLKTNLLTGTIPANISDLVNIGKTFSAHPCPNRILLLTPTHSLSPRYNGFTRQRPNRLDPH
jgi:hypothetical protein